MFDPRKWFTRRPQGPDEAMAEPQGEVSQAEVSAFLDPYNSRALVVDGSRAMIEPGQVFENIHNLMERIDNDPSITWAPEDAVSVEECAALAQMCLWEMTVEETAWSARRVLASGRWPMENVELPIGADARLSMFMDGPGFVLPEGAEERAKAVLNRALASGESEVTHPELAGLSQNDLMQTWLPLLAWFAAKSAALHTLRED